MVIYLLRKIFLITIKCANSKNMQIVKIFNVMIAECYLMIVYLKANLDLKSTSSNIYYFMYTNHIDYTSILNIKLHNYY